jgi:Tol biopolymer transport system component
MVLDPLGTESLLFANRLDKFPTSWSPDGRFILFTARTPETDSDLWILPVNDDPKPYQFVHTTASETGGQFSPAGGWIAYASDESRQAEVFVAPFPGPGDRTQISVNGGNLPQWRGDGKEIFYRTPDNRMVATEITTAGGRVVAGRSQTLFDMGNVRRGGMSWDVSPDGQRFLVVTPVDVRSETSLGLLQNWPALLRKQ